MQVVMCELLDAWGRNGLIAHVKKMQTDYKNRAAIVQQTAGLFSPVTSPDVNLPSLGSSAMYTQECMLCNDRTIACCDTCIELVCTKSADDNVNTVENLLDVCRKAAGEICRMACSKGWHVPVAETQACRGFHGHL